MNTMLDGARIAVHENLNIQPDEKVVIVTDRETEHVAQTIENEVRTITDQIEFFRL